MTFSRLYNRKPGLIALLNVVVGRVGEPVGGAIDATRVMRDNRIAVLGRYQFAPPFFVLILTGQRVLYALDAIRLRLPTFPGLREYGGRDRSKGESYYSSKKEQTDRGPENVD